MDVGIFFELRNPTGDPSDQRRVYDFALEACEEAEHLGIRSLWFCEHHGFEDGHCPQPLLFAAAAATRTRQARLGTSLLVAPIRTPASIAEEAAMVDLLSNGRLHLGLGSGYIEEEYDLYGCNGLFSTRSSAVVDIATTVLNMWASGQATPAPLRGTVPIWIGASGSKAAYRAGLIGAGLLRIDPALYDAYLDGLRAGGHDVSTARMNGPMHVFLTNDPDRDWPQVAQGVARQWSSFHRHQNAHLGVRTEPVHPEEVSNGTMPGGPGVGYLCSTPAVVAASIRQFTAGLPIDGFHMWASPGGLSEDLMIENIRLAATELALLLSDDSNDVSVGEGNGMKEE